MMPSMLDPIVPPGASEALPSGISRQRTLEPALSFGPG
jgi:hypothetical protein